jgi:hypothetical protein
MQNRYHCLQHATNEVVFFLDRGARRAGRSCYYYRRIPGRQTGNRDATNNSRGSQAKRNK